MLPRLLIVAADAALREHLQRVLEPEGCEALCAADGEAALAAVSELPFDAVLCDEGLPGGDGLELASLLMQRLPGAALIALTDREAPERALAALERGASGYLGRPFAPSEARLALRQALEGAAQRRRSARLEREMQRAVRGGPIVAASPPMIELLEQMERIAPWRTPVLLTGESGTGKEGLARAVHAQSRRRHEAFVVVDCGATTGSRLEGELLGRTAGAVAEGDRAHRGFFEEAHGGTLYLDEVGALPLPLQATLLRVLQEERVWRVGSSKPRALDVRVIAATARDLGAMAARGAFREDLLHRLQALALRVPPLRDRPLDIPLLVDHFRAHSSASLGRSVRRVGDAAMARLVAYPWPGNVRELAGVIERAVLLAASAVVTPRELPADVAHPAPARSGPPGGHALRPARKAFEARMIRRALDATGGNRTHAARLLEISHRALLYKLRDYGIDD